MNRSQSFEQFASRSPHRTRPKLGLIAGRVAVVLVLVFVVGHAFAATTAASSDVSISTFWPGTGVPGSKVTVKGTGFTNAKSLQLGTSAPTSVTITNDTLLTFLIPTDATTGRIIVASSSSAAKSNATFKVTPPTPPIGQAAAARLLSQGTFGATRSTLSSTAAQTYAQWFSAQASATPTYTASKVSANGGDWTPLWWSNVVNGPDQLRQRLAFALSEILVVSDQSNAIGLRSQAAPAYQDILVKDAFGNFRTLLDDVTRSPTMGIFLNTLRSDKANVANGSHADQNYAREIMQLFTVGLVKLNIDGSVQLDGNNNGIPTYSQSDVENLARVFTGWGSAPTDHTGDDAWTYDTDVLHPMVAYDVHHDTDAKTIIGNTYIASGGTTTADLKIALDTLFNHPNVGPFVGKQLIQRLVTSNPSPSYVQRVATVFNNNGSGVRGDMLAVVTAILTDPEAITPRSSDYGKVREPLLRLTALWRAFSAKDSSGGVNEYSVVTGADTMFAQSPLSSPTVFNFFQPDYQRTGVTANAGLVAPELEIVNESTLVQTANQLQRQAYAFTDSTGKSYFTPQGYSETSGSVKLQTADWENDAATPSTLIDQLNLVLMAGQMSDSMKSILVNYISNISTSEASYRGYRVIEAADLIINSSQYAVQH